MSVQPTAKDDLMNEMAISCLISSTVAAITILRMTRVIALLLKMIITLFLELCVRRQHNATIEHRENLYTYYEKIAEQHEQDLINQKICDFRALPCPRANLCPPFFEHPLCVTRQQNATIEHREDPYTWYKKIVKQHQRDLINQRICNSRVVPSGTLSLKEGPSQKKEHILPSHSNLA